MICVLWVYWEELVQMTTRISCLRSRSWLCEASRVALLPWLWCIILQYLWIFYVFGSGINHVTVTKILCSHIILRVWVPGSWICVFLMFLYSFSEFYIVCLILCIILIVTKWTVTLWPIVCVIVSQVRIHESELKCMRTSVQTNNMSLVPLCPVSSGFHISRSCIFDYQNQ